MQHHLRSTQKTCLKNDLGVAYANSKWRFTMKKSLTWSTLFILAAMLTFAPSCWAKSTGYCYIVGYSFAKKKAFFSPILIQKVNSKSYSDEEFVTDVELIQKMESQFQSHLSRQVSLDAGKYTVLTRGAYKSNAIAKNKYKDEMSLYETKGFVVTIVKDFRFSD
jgi:hypothetical protein